MATGYLNIGDDVVDPKNVTAVGPIIRSRPAMPKSGETGQTESRDGRIGPDNDGTLLRLAWSWISSRNCRSVPCNMMEAL